MSCRRLAVGLKLGRTRVVPEAVAECLRNACLDHFLCRRTPLRNPVRKRVARSHRHPLCFAIAIKGNLWGGIEQPELWIRLTPHCLAGGMTVTSCDHPLPYLRLLAEASNHCHCRGLAALPCACLRTDVRSDFTRASSTRHAGNARNSGS